MEPPKTYEFTENFLKRLAREIVDQHLVDGNDLSRLAVVFGGRRPALFLNRELGRLIQRPFFPPRFFSMDDFVEHVISRRRSNEPFQRIPELEVCYLVYRLALEHTPEILKNRKTFSDFLPWAREIVSFIEQLDLEDIQEDALNSVSKNARIGYDVPADINQLLVQIRMLRRAYHQSLMKSGQWTRGLMYRITAREAGDIDLEDFEKIIFANLFYLHKTEAEIIHSFYQRGRAILAFQGDEREWPVLRELASQWNISIKAPDAPKPDYKLKLYAGFDTHSQAGLIRDVVSRIDCPEETVIVVPKPDHAVALLSELAPILREFNISLGYPLRRSSLYSLISHIFSAQKGKKGGAYYSKDYLKVLQHPFVKNLRLNHEPAVARVLIHKIEEVLLGEEKSALGGSLFLELKNVEQETVVSDTSRDILKGMGISTDEEIVEKTLAYIHDLFFRRWEEVRSFAELGAVLEDFIDKMVDSSSLADYPLNLSLVKRILDIQGELSSCSFGREHFSQEEVFRIFLDHLENEIVAFSGSPLKGLQILGLLETRSLNFKNVIVMDVNESALPVLQINQPLIPREVMIGLNLTRLEKEEEIQRYQFMRLLGGAQNVHLVYEDSTERERSRFIEELIWQKEKEAGSLDVLTPVKGNFQVNVAPKKVLVQKTPEMLEYLKQFHYSATSLNTYVRNPLRFYFQYVLGLEEKEDLLDEPESVDVGDFIHKLLEEAFRPFVGRRPVLDGVFRKNFQRTLDERFTETLLKRMGPDAFLLKSVLDARLARFLENEQERDVAKIISLEQKYDGRLKFAMGEFQFTCRVDRIDQLSDGRVLIVDYKTGNADLLPIVPRAKSKESQNQSGPFLHGEPLRERGESLRAKSPSAGVVPLLTRAEIKETIRSFQIPLYYHFLRDEFPGQTLDAAFYSLRTLELNFLSKKRGGFDAQALVDYSLKALEHIFAELLDPEIPFKADDSDPNYCRMCPFTDLCR